MSKEEINKSYILDDDFISVIKKIDLKNPKNHSCEVLLFNYMNNEDVVGFLKAIALNKGFEFNPEFVKNECTKIIDNKIVDEDIDENIGTTNSLSEILLKAGNIASQLNINKINNWSILKALMDTGINFENQCPEIMRQSGFENPESIFDKMVAEKSFEDDEDDDIKEYEDSALFNDPWDILSNVVARSITPLNKKANDKFFKVVGREQQIDDAIRILNRKVKHNVMFVGDAGVGKTSVVYGLAQRINNQEVPDNLKDKVIYEVNMTTLLAGTKYRGDLEDRLKQVIEFANKDENCILFLDGINSASNGSVSDITNILKPALSSGDITCIATTTHDEYQQSIEKDATLKRRFQPVKVPEPNNKEAYCIIKGIICDFEKHYNVTYSDDAIKTAIELSQKYMNDSCLPDKAIDLIDEAGSLVTSENKQDNKVGKKDVQKLVSMMFDIPIEKLQKRIDKKLKDLEPTLKNKIFGQNEAIEQINAKIILGYAGLNQDRKPEGSFLFLGPTGVGKTEVVNVLANHLDRNLIRLDMSEYMDKNTSSKIIGAPPGYVGYEDGNPIFDQVNRYPDSIILVDEVEKAHKDILNLFLQILDNGHITNSKGKSIDFTKTLIVMTSNQGAEEMQKGNIGFVNSENNIKANAEESVNSFFRPELRNRIDNIIYFNALNHDNVMRIVQEMIKEITDSISTKHKFNLSVDNNLVEHIAKEGFDPLMGARPLKRMIENKVVLPIAKYIVTDKIKRNQNVKLMVNKKDEVLIEFT